MMNELTFSSGITVIGENLSRLDSELLHNQEKRLAHLKELAHLLAVQLRSGTEEPIRAKRHEILSILFSRIDQNQVPLRPLLADLSRAELFCVIRFATRTLLTGKTNGELYERIFAYCNGDTVQSRAAKASDARLNSVVCMNNAYSDACFEALERMHRSPEHVYVPDFRSVCETVADSRADAGILPLENMKDGKLRRFYDLLDEYDLKIAGSCIVSRSQTGESHRLVLLKNRYAAISVMKNMEMELMVPDDGTVLLCDLLRTAEDAGLSLQSADTFSSDRDIEERQFDLCFSVEEGDAAAFLMYLFFTSPHARLLGIFPQMFSESELSKGETL